MQRKKSFKNLRCILTFILALCIAFSACTSVFAAQTSGTCGDGLTWSFDAASGTLTVEGAGAIPDYLWNSSVPWSEIAHQVKQLVISEDVTSIGSYAFYGMENLTEIIVPNGVTSVGAYAFYNCIRVKTLTIGENVSNMGRYAFAYLKSLAVLHYNAISASVALNWDILQDGYTHVFSSVFYAAGVAGQGVEVVFGDNVVTVPPYIFGRQIYDLVEEKAPYPWIHRVYSELLDVWSEASHVHMIKPYPVNKVTSVRFGTAVEYIDECAFAHCNTLQSITFSDNIHYIGSNAFSCGTSNVKLNFLREDCYAARHVQSCAKTPLPKIVFRRCTLLSIEPMHLLRKGAVYSEKIEPSYDGALIIKALSFPVGITAVVKDTTMILALPFWPVYRLMKFFENIVTYHIGYYQYIQL